VCARIRPIPDAGFQDPRTLHKGFFYWQKMKNADEILFSKLEADVNPYEWVSALLADYKTLREKAIAAGVEVTDDPDAESQCLSEVRRLCEAAHEKRMHIENLKEAVRNL